MLTAARAFMVFTTPRRSWALCMLRFSDSIVCMARLFLHGFRSLAGRVEERLAVIQAQLVPRLDPPAEIGILRNGRLRSAVSASPILPMGI